MIDANAVALSVMIEISSMSSISSYSGQYTHEPNFDATGSFSNNGDWLAEQSRSGQSISIVVHEQKNVLEQKFNTIKHAFAMNDDELAKRLGVQRKTLFNWKNEESSPKADKIQLIFDLYLLARNWLDAGFSTSKVDLSLAILAGQSIRSMLLEPTLDSEKILFAGHRLAHRSLKSTDLF